MSKSSRKKKKECWTEREIAAHMMLEYKLLLFQSLQRTIKLISVEWCHISYKAAPTIHKTQHTARAAALPILNTKLLDLMTWTKTLDTWTMMSLMSLKTNSPYFRTGTNHWSIPNAEFDHTVCSPSVKICWRELWIKTSREITCWCSMMKAAVDLVSQFV